MKLEKLIIETLDILLHGPVAVEAVFLSHPAPTLRNIE
jgi:hypothetical protein